MPTAVPSRTDTLYTQIALERQKTSTERVHAAVRQNWCKFETARSTPVDQRLAGPKTRSGQPVLGWRSGIPSARCGNLSGSAPVGKPLAPPHDRSKESLRAASTLPPREAFCASEQLVLRGLSRPDQSERSAAGGRKLNPREAASGFRMGEGLGERTAIVRCTKRARKGQSHFSSCLEPKAMLPTL